MSIPTEFGGCDPFQGSGPATAWIHIGNFDEEVTWSCYAFASNDRVPILMNVVIAINLIIDKCNSLQAQIDAFGDPAEEYKLTARKICEAWAKDDFEDRALTIAFIDRQRQLIWDEPFYIRWAAKPESEY